MSETFLEMVKRKQEELEQLTMEVRSLVATNEDLLSIFDAIGCSDRLPTDCLRLAVARLKAGEQVADVVRSFA